MVKNNRVWFLMWLELENNENLWIVLCSVDWFIVWLPTSTQLYIHSEFDCSTAAQKIEIKLNCSNSFALPQFSLIPYPWIPWLKRTIFSIDFTLHDDFASLLLILWDLFWVSVEWEAEGKQFEFYNQSARSKGGGKAKTTEEGEIV